MFAWPTGCEIRSALPSCARHQARARSWSGGSCSVARTRYPNYVNVPDGGHIENLGAYELLWRKCRQIVSIDYGGGQTGYLLYIKSSLTGNKPDYVRDYRQSNRTFPHETTADQFFSEAQFEAYRALGEHIGDDLFPAELIGRRDSISLTQWFDAMRRTLLAP